MAKLKRKKIRLLRILLTGNMPNLNLMKRIFNQKEMKILTKKLKRI